MTKLLVVLGITGTQGGSVATKFCSQSEWKVRGLTRDPSSKSALPWSEKGVELVRGDLNDTSSLVAAFKGANAIFATTNFWDSFYNPGTQSLLKPGQNIGEYCYELELQQIKNIADAASAVEGLERLVVSTLCHASKRSNGKFTWVYHFDSKATGLDYLKTQYPTLAAKMSTIQMGPYMSNFNGNVNLRKADDGSIYLTVLKGTGNTPKPHVDTVRDTGSLVLAALEAPPGKNILGTGANINSVDQLKEFCDIHGLKYGGLDEVTLEQFEQFIPVPGLGRELGEMFLFMDEFGYTGGDDSIVSPEDLGVPCPMTSWGEYVKGEDWSKVLAPLK